MNSFTNIFEGFENTNLTFSYFTKQLFLETPFLRGSAQSAFNCSNSIELASTMYKVNNKDTRTTSFDVFLVSFNFEQILHLVLVLLLLTLSR